MGEFIPFPICGEIRISKWLRNVWRRSKEIASGSVRGTLGYGQHYKVPIGGIVPTGLNTASQHHQSYKAQQRASHFLEQQLSTNTIATGVSFNILIQLSCIVLVIYKTCCMIADFTASISALEIYIILYLEKNY